MLGCQTAKVRGEERHRNAGKNLEDKREQTSETCFKVAMAIRIALIYRR